MRSDMKEVIVEVARTGGRYDSRDRVTKAFDRQRYTDIEDHYYPNRLPMGRHWKIDYKSIGDKLNPLEKFLRSKVGQKWDDIYSEICAVNDRRGILGYHLHTHLVQLVQAKGLRRGSFGYGDFYVRQDGILVELGRGWRYPKDEKEPRIVNEIPGSDGWTYRYRVHGKSPKSRHGVWFKEKTEHVMGWLPAVRSLDGLVELKPRRIGVVDTIDRKVQVGKKELKQVRELVAKGRGIYVERRDKETVQREWLEKFNARRRAAGEKVYQLSVV